MTTFEQVRVSESHTREAFAEIRSAPEFRTPKGRAPMLPISMRVHYVIGRPEWTWVEVMGTRADAGEEPKYHRGQWPETFIRRVPSEQLGAAPEWLREFVEAHRPVEDGGQA